MAKKTSLLVGALLCLSSQLLRAADEQAPDYARHFSLWVTPNAGSAMILNDPALKDAVNAGYLMGMRATFSMAVEKAVVDLTGGWATTRVPVEASQAHIDTGAALPHSVATSFGEAEIAARFRVREPFEMGVALLVPFGVDTTFSASGKQDKTPNVFLGGQLLLNNLGDGAANANLWRLGLQVAKDLNITGRDVMFIRAQVSLGFPWSVEPKYIVKTKVRRQIVTKYRDRIKERVKIVYKEKALYFVDAGLFNFETGKSNITANTADYLIALAQLLQRNETAWNYVLVVSHTDERGGRNFNTTLSQQRAQAITELLMGQGLAKTRLIVESKVDGTPVDTEGSSVALARNRRVEISIVGGEQMADIKREILTLLQRFTIPSTCVGDDCN